MVLSMMKKIYWLCDAIGITGSVLFLYGVYLLWSLAIVLVISGLMLMMYASRLSYCHKRDDSR